MYHSVLIHSSADGHLGCFHLLAIINRSTQIYTLDPDGWLQTRPASPPTGTARLQDKGGCGTPGMGNTHLTEAMHPRRRQVQPLRPAASHLALHQPCLALGPCFPRASVCVTAGGPIPYGPQAFIFQEHFPLFPVRL